MGGRGILVPLDRGAAFLIASSFSTYSAAGALVSASPIKNQQGRRDIAASFSSSIPSFFAPKRDGRIQFSEIRRQ
jgi:hypothetical protein